MTHSATRRNFLRSAGTALALPWLETFARTAESPERRPCTVAINLGLGFHADYLFPKAAGWDYELTPYLEVLKDFRDQFTIISGTSHPDVGGGHLSDSCFLTAAAHPESASFRNSISMDQLMAAHVGAATRFSYLSLSVLQPGSGDPGAGGLSWSRSGVRLPSISQPADLYARLFLEGSAEEKRRQLQRLRDGQSIMDTVLTSARGLQRTVSARDREKLDQYFTVVRETEQRLHQAEEWEHRRKPKTDLKRPPEEITGTDIFNKATLFYELIHLALETDSTRVVTLSGGALSGVPNLAGATIGYHGASHHGNDPQKLAQLKLMEMAQLTTFRAFLKRLASSGEQSGTLLDRTQILLGSNLGNASSHDTKNLPVILAGGGYNHGQHLAFDAQNNEPLPKLFVTMIQRMGIDADSFAGISGTLNGIISTVED